MAARNIPYRYSVFNLLAGVLLLAGMACIEGHAQQQPSPTIPPPPPKMFTIQGQVSLPDGRPAVHVLVTLTSSASRRQTYTVEQGRFEFPSMDAGSYSLMASSLVEPHQVSETLDTDTNRTATRTLNVNLILREASEGTKHPRVRAISAVEAEQRIPKEAHKAFSQGVRFKQGGQRDKALERFSQAIELYPSYFQAMSERGDLYVAQRKLDEAAADFAQALKVDDHYGPALRGSGYCKLEKKEFALAIEDFERSLSAEPDNANTHLLLGIASLELDRREAAREALQKALNFNTQPMPRAHIYLASLYAREGQYLKAADELHKYIEADPLAADAAAMREIEAKWRARAAAP